MPPIDPQQLLKALGPLLTDTGGIRGAQEASRIASLMKDASKLVTRCIYLNILRATTSREALDKFMEVSGWDTLNHWLEIARDDNNDPLLGEILEVYQVMPVTVGLLKQNSAAKTIKQLSKAEKEKIKTLSSKLVDRWTKVIRDQNNSTDNESEDKKKKKKHRDKEGDKDKEKSEKDKENEKKERDEKDSEKQKKREKDSRDHHRHREKDKDRDRKDRRDKDKEKEGEKDKSKREKSKSNSDSKDSTLKNQSLLSSSSSSASSSSADPALSSKSKDSSRSSKKLLSADEVKLLVTTSAPSNSAVTISTENADTESSKNDDESRRRPKTVKQIVTKFRSTGLFDEEEEEAEPLKKKTEKIPVKRVGVDIKPEELSEKKPRLHLPMPTLTPANLDPSSTTPPEVTHGRIKIIPPKRAPAHEIQESNVFMDALQQSTYSAGIKKKKKLVSPSTTAAPLLFRGPSATSPPPASSPPSATSPPPGVQGGETGPTSPPLLSPTTAMAQKLPSVPSFYRDTLEDTPENTESENKAEEKEDDSPPPLENMETDILPQEEESKEGESLMDVALEKTSEENYTEFLTEASGDADRPKGKKSKKSVSWAREAYLEEIFYFELDETERENVNRPKTFSEMKKEEMLLDRRAMESVKRFHNDTMVEVLQWKLPRPIDNVISLIEPGSNSVEKQIQMEREQIVLCALFFNKVPDTPSEPDPDIPSEQMDMKVIPLEDENGSCSEYEHTYTFNDPSSLPYDPEFGALPLQNQSPSNHQSGGPPMGGGSNNMNNNMGNMSNNMVNNNSNNNNNNNRGPMNIPPPISHILNTLQQQAQESRDPVMQNLQGMLTNVLQNTNPQDSGMLMERILNALEPFKNQIPGLSNLINSVTGHGMEGNMGGGGPRFMGPPGQMGNPRHGLLGSAPPGFNMMGGGGNMRPNMPGPAPPLMGNGGGMGGNPNFYMGGGGGGNMRMGGPPWRGGRGRPFGKRGGARNVVCQFFVKKGMCKYGDGCQFIHPGPNS